MTKRFWSIYASLLAFYLYGMLISAALEDDRVPIIWSITTGVVATLFLFAATLKIIELKDE